MKAAILDDARGWFENEQDPPARWLWVPELSSERHDRNTNRFCCPPLPGPARSRDGSRAALAACSESAVDAPETFCFLAFLGARCAPVSSLDVRFHTATAPSRWPRSPRRASARAQRKYINTATSRPARSSSRRHGDRRGERGGTMKDLRPSGQGAAKTVSTPAARRTGMWFRAAGTSRSRNRVVRPASARRWATMYGGQSDNGGCRTPVHNQNAPSKPMDYVLPPTQAFRLATFLGAAGLPIKHSSSIRRPWGSSPLVGPRVHAIQCAPLAIHLYEPEHACPGARQGR